MSFNTVPGLEAVNAVHHGLGERVPPPWQVLVLLS